MYAIKNGTASFRWVPENYIAQTGETLVPLQPVPKPEEIFDGTAWVFGQARADALKVPV